MHSAHDLLTRWPVLDASAKRARLQETFHITAGPLDTALSDDAPAADRACAGLCRRDPSVWSAGPAVQKTIANRLGWLSSPPARSPSLPPLGAFPFSLKDQCLT